MHAFRPIMVIIRFLGITPTSSAVHTLLISICQQLCYNLEVPIEEIPTDFVPLKNYFRSLLEKASKAYFTIILLGKSVFKKLTQLAFLRNAAFNNGAGLTIICLFF